MKLKISAWVMYIVLLGGLGIVQFHPSVTQAAPKQHPDAAPLAATQTICKNQAIPSGWVITAQGSSTSCPGSYPNTWTIQTPVSPMTICKVSPLPTDWVITAQGSSTSCPGSGLGGSPNTWSVRTPVSPMTICKVSPIPSGYVITGEGSSTSCPGSGLGGSPNTWRIRQI